VAVVLTDVTVVAISDALDALRWTVSDLALKAGVDTNTVLRAMTPGGKASTNNTSAEAIAAALGLTVSQVLWPNGTTNRGRPAATGVPVARTAQYHEDVCPVHYITLPTSKLCDMCA